MIDEDLYERFKFFHENAGGVVGHMAEVALRLARAERKAEAQNLRVSWEDELEAWDGECPAPPILVSARVPRPGNRKFCLASLGMIGLNSWSDTYVRVVRAELLAEALETLDEELEAKATDQARELASRATYAGPASNGYVWEASAP